MRVPHGSGRLDFGQGELAGDPQLEAPAPHAFERDRGVGPRQPAAQDEQACLEVVGARGQPESLVEAKLAVGEVGALVGVRVQQPPEDPPWIPRIRYSPSMKTLSSAW